MVFCGLLFGTNFANSPNVICNAFITHAIVYVDGQCGEPSRFVRLLLLNVVESNPDNRARPEQDIFFHRAIFAIPTHKSLCVIIPPICYYEYILSYFGDLVK